MSQRSYLDWNATAPMREEAKVAFVEALAVAGNPSSIHAEGRSARRLVETAREEVAALVGAQPSDVFFTSSGTEANMSALTPAIEIADQRQQLRLRARRGQLVDHETDARRPGNAPVSRGFLRRRVGKCERVFR